MEARTYSLCRAATPRRRPGPGGTNRRQPTWPLAARAQPRASHRLANDLLQLNRPIFRRDLATCLIHRTAVYGPVRTVVWEGWSRETPPYPDRNDKVDDSPHRDADRIDRDPDVLAACGDDGCDRHRPGLSARGNDLCDWCAGGVADLDR